LIGLDGQDGQLNAIGPESPDPAGQVAAAAIADGQLIPGFEAQDIADMMKIVAAQGQGNRGRIVAVFDEKARHDLSPSA
jgi:hypothetical protein